MAEYINKAALKEAFEEDGHLSAYVEDMIDSAPSIHIPERHGRLIDADAIPYNKIMLEDDDFYYGVTKPYIDRMPTVIPAEEE